MVSVWIYDAIEFLKQPFKSELFEVSTNRPLINLIEDSQVEVRILEGKNNKEKLSKFMNELKLVYVID